MVHSNSDSSAMINVSSIVLSPLLVGSLAMIAVNSDFMRLAGPVFTARQAQRTVSWANLPHFDEERMNFGVRIDDSSVTTAGEGV